MRWRDRGRPDLQEFSVFCETVGLLRYDFRGLDLGMRLEFQYALQRRVDERRARACPLDLAPLLAQFRRLGSHSFLDHTVEEWGSVFSLKTCPTRSGFLRFAVACIKDLVEGVGWENEFPRDIWYSRRLGLQQGGTGAPLASFSFVEIRQRWLKSAVKRYLRSRLSAGLSWASLSRDRIAIVDLSSFLHRVHPGAATAGVLDREMLERWLAHLVTVYPHVRTRDATMGAVRKFLVQAQQHEWMPGLPTRAVIHGSDRPRRPEQLARYLSEHVMSQLEDEANLSRFADARFAMMTRIIMGTGLRQADARLLAFDCLTRDGLGAPYLKYRNHKMKREALVPIDEALAARI